MSNQIFFRDFGEDEHLICLCREWKDDGEHLCALNYTDYLILLS